MSRWCWKRQPERDTYICVHIYIYIYTIVPKTFISKGYNPGRKTFMFHVSEGRYSWTSKLTKRWPLVLLLMEGFPRMDFIDVYLALHSWVHSFFGGGMVFINILNHPKPWRCAKDCMLHWKNVQNPNVTKQNKKQEYNTPHVLKAGKSVSLSLRNLISEINSPFAYQRTRPIDFPSFFTNWQYPLDPCMIYSYIFTNICLIFRVKFVGQIYQSHGSYVWDISKSVLRNSWLREGLWVFFRDPRCHRKIYINLRVLEVQDT